MRQQGDPSVDEILESIKKVIARDTRAAPAQTRVEAPVACHHESHHHHDDVLDLAASARFLDHEDEEAHEDSLVNDSARSSMRESLAALAMMSQPSAQPQIVRSGETSLETLTRDLLRPALAQWLDTHLPPMVERMVAEEIARIVGKKF